MRVACTKTKLTQFAPIFGYEMEDLGWLRKSSDAYFRQGNYGN
jgi:hypothetical protein